MTRPELPKEISAELWKEALANTARKEAEMAKLRKPGDPPIVSSVEQHIFEELLDEKARDQADSQARKTGELSE